NQESRLPPGSDFRRWVWITIAPFVTIAERINEAGYQTKAGKAWDKDIYSAWKRQGSNAEKLKAVIDCKVSV
ncbi:hypothetical protein, partial [Escherichia coli]|uniref:hypothetical protein n=1 Tax=Escherichia coli TaxID=562 RepID=UPI001A7E07A0